MVSDFSNIYQGLKLALRMFACAMVQVCMLVAAQQRLAQLQLRPSQLAFHTCGLKNSLLLSNFRIKTRA